MIRRVAFPCFKLELLVPRKEARIRSVILWPAQTVMIPTLRLLLYSLNEAIAPLNCLGEGEDDYGLA